MTKLPSYPNDLLTLRTLLTVSSIIMKMLSSDSHTIFCLDPCRVSFFGHSCAIKSQEFGCASETSEKLIVPFDHTNDVGS